MDFVSSATAMSMSIIPSFRFFSAKATAIDLPIPEPPRL
jgi:hypothetical protein